MPQDASLDAVKRSWRNELQKLHTAWIEAEKKRRLAWVQDKHAEILRLQHEHQTESSAMLDSCKDERSWAELKAAAERHMKGLQALLDQVDVSLPFTPLHEEAPALVYVLQCEHDKFYVGRCVRRRRAVRMQEHRGMKSDLKDLLQGSEWTRRHRFVRVLEEKPCWDYLQENMIVLQWMRDKGIDNVRGGPWPMCDLGHWRAEIERQLDNASDSCFLCHNTSHFAAECPSRTQRHRTPPRPAAGFAAGKSSPPSPPPVDLPMRPAADPAAGKSSPPSPPLFKPAALPAAAAAAAAAAEARRAYPSPLLEQQAAAAAATAVEAHRAPSPPSVEPAAPPAAAAAAAAAAAEARRAPSPPPLKPAALPSSSSAAEATAAETCNTTPPKAPIPPPTLPAAASTPQRSCVTSPHLLPSSAATPPPDPHYQPCRWSLPKSSPPHPPLHTPPDINTSAAPAPASTSAAAVPNIINTSAASASAAAAAAAVPNVINASAAAAAAAAAAVPGTANGPSNCTSSVTQSPSSARKRGRELSTACDAQADAAPPTWLCTRLAQLSTGDHATSAARAAGGSSTREPVQPWTTASSHSHSRAHNNSYTSAQTALRASCNASPTNPFQAPVHACWPPTPLTHNSYTSAETALRASCNASPTKPCQAPVHARWPPTSLTSGGDSSTSSGLGLPHNTRARPSSATDPAVLQPGGSSCAGRGGGITASPSLQAQPSLLPNQQAHTAPLAQAHLHHTLPHHKAVQAHQTHRQQQQQQQQQQAPTQAPVHATPPQPPCSRCGRSGHTMLYDSHVDTYVYDCWSKTHCVTQQLLPAGHHRVPLS